MIQINDKLFEPYISQDKIQERIRKMAHEFNSLELENPLMVVVLNGAIFFATDFMKTLNQPIEMAFIRVSSYQGTQSQGKLNYKLWLDQAVAGRTIILLEDIVDTGYTISELIKKLEQEGAKKVLVVSLLDKQEARKYPVDIAVKGFDIPNKFVVGYGLDYDSVGRGLVDIYQLKKG